MKKSLIIGAAIAALIVSAGGAKAADIVTYQQAPVAAATPAAIDWTGLYVGGTIGGSWADAGTSLHEKNSDWSGKVVGTGTSPDSFIGGIYAGYNFQIPMINNAADFLHAVVFGVETDWLFNSGTGNGHKKYPYIDSDTYDVIGEGVYSASVRQRWNGSTRIRVGTAIGSEGRFLPYLAGGVSYADIRSKAGARYHDDQDDIDGTWGPRSKTKTRAGWNIGAGVDYVPPILNDHIILRAEYRYTDFGKSTYSWKGIDEDGDAWKISQRSKYYQNDFRVGVAYKF